MFPISDDNSDRTRTPYVNYMLIAINILVFVVYQRFGSDLHFTYSFATVPAEILSGRDIVTEAVLVHDPISGKMVQVPGLGITPMPVFFTIITSMFMHGGLGHLAGNMLYLWIFGDNLEDMLGHVRYFLFYMLCGIIATLTHVGSVIFMDQNYLIPTLGASGAISGIMGGYLIAFPVKRVTVLVFFFFIKVPAFIVLGFWIMLQIANGTGYLGGSEASGIAYAAHIGGFIAGLILINRFHHLKEPRKSKGIFT